MTIPVALPCDQHDKLLHVLGRDFTSLPGDGVFFDMQPDKLLNVFGYDNPNLSAR